MTVVPPPARLESLPPGCGADDIGLILWRRLRDSGEPPYSLCEISASADEYAWLLAWAGSVTPRRLERESPHGGLAFLALLAEYNRRHSRGGTVYVGVPERFERVATRTALFTAGGDPLLATREWIRDTSERFRLRNAFVPEFEDRQRWYLTIQMQYGFCRAHLEQGLEDWLGGQPATGAVRLLLGEERRWRSRRFRRLMTDLRSFREDYLTEVDVRRMLGTCPWVLPEWHDDLIRIVTDPGVVIRSRLAEEPPEIVWPPRLAWEEGRGPTASCRLGDLDGLRPTASRYHLRHEGRLVASWFRQESGGYDADGTEVELPVVWPQAILRLEDPAGEGVLVQAVTLWDEAEDVQVLPLGRGLVEGAAPAIGEPVVLILREGLRVAVDPLDWRLVGRGEHRRRWVAFTALQPGLRVEDERGAVVWQAGTPAAPPAWVGGVSVGWRQDRPYLGVGDSFALRIRTPPGVVVDYATGNGRPLEFADPDRALTKRIRFGPEHAGGACQVRVGVSCGGTSAVVRATVEIPARGLAELVGSVDGPGWRWRDGARPLSIAAAEGRSFRVFTDGADALLEGSLVHGRRPPGRAHPLGRLLGTGGVLRLARGPYCPVDEFPIAAHAVDFGLVTRLSVDDGPPRALRLNLARGIAPTDEHELILWSERRGPERVERGRIEVEDDGRTWRAAVLGDNAPGGLLCGVAFRGYRLGFGWHGDRSWAFADGPTLPAAQRLALIRWFRLPALMPDLGANRRPAMQPLAQAHPADLVAVAMLDQGLDGLPGGLRLLIEGSARERQHFETIARALLFDFHPSRGQADDIERLLQGEAPGGQFWDQYVRLLLHHPLLAARVMLAGWLSKVPQNQRPQARHLLRQVRFAVAGFPTLVPRHEYRNRREQIRERATATLSEGSRTPDTGLTEGLSLRAVRVVLHGEAYEQHERHNLLVALGSAAFRQFVGLRLMEDLEHRQ
jgi:hypothetical protein